MVSCRSLGSVTQVRGDRALVRDPGEREVGDPNGSRSLPGSLPVAVALLATALPWGQAPRVPDLYRAVALEHGEPVERIDVGRLIVHNGPSTFSALVRNL